MKTSNSTHPSEAGLDTTTGHGVDSFFHAEGQVDPWSSLCVTIFIDTIINHEQTLFPLWSRAVVDNLEDELLPMSFAISKKHNLLKSITKTSADEIRLPAETLKSEFDNFNVWAKSNARKVAGWVRYHREAPRIVQLHKLAKSTWLQADKHWKRRNKTELLQQTGLSDSDLNFAYETFLRSIHYHNILGENTPYISHPIRSRAFGQVPVILQHQEQWSWGRYFVEIMNDGLVPKNIDWVLDQASKIKDLTKTNNATWYVLGKSTKKEQQEMLSSIASEANLPMKLKDSTHKAMKLALGTGAVLSSTTPLIGVILGLGVSVVELWNGRVPGIVGKVPIFKGQLTLPGLFNTL